VSDHGQSDSLAPQSEWIPGTEIRRNEVVAWLKLWHCYDSLIFHQANDHGPLDFYRDAHCRDAQ
jgi:hypothetical protein